MEYSPTTSNDQRNNRGQWITNSKSRIKVETNNRRMPGDNQQQPQGQNCSSNQGLGADKQWGWGHWSWEIPQVHDHFTYSPSLWRLPRTDLPHNLVPFGSSGKQCGCYATWTIHPRKNPVLDTSTNPKRGSRENPLMCLEKQLWVRIAPSQDWTNWVWRWSPTNCCGNLGVEKTHRTLTQLHSSPMLMIIHQNYCNSIEKWWVTMNHSHHLAQLMVNHRR